MFLRKLQANVSNHADTLLLIDWYQYHTLLLFAVSDRKSRVTHSAVRTYRIISSVSLLILQVLSHGRSIYFYFTDDSAHTSSDTASTWCVCRTKKVWGVQSSTGALIPLVLKWKSEKISHVSLTNLHTQRFAVTISFRRKLLTLRQLSHGRNIYFYFADASARTSSDTASTWCVCGTQKVRGTFWELIAFH